MSEIHEWYIKKRGKAMTLFQILCFFMIYAFLGWCVEVIYQASKKGKVVNRGFLNGPICPIYGFGVIAIVLLMELIFGGDAGNVHAVLIFIFGTLITTAIELIGGFLMDKLFHSRWWDYRGEPLNLNGYICLKFSLIWGLAILVVMRIVHPFISGIVSTLEETLVSWIVVCAVYVIFIADVIVSAMIVIGLNKKYAQIDEIRKQMRKFSDELSTDLGEGTLETMEYAEDEKEKAERFINEKKLKNDMHLLAILKDLDPDIDYEPVTEKTSNRLYGYGRVLHAYPDMVQKNYLRARKLQ